MARRISNMIGPIAHALFSGRRSRISRKCPQWAVPWSSPNYSRRCPHPDVLIFALCLRLRRRSAMTGRCGDPGALRRADGPVGRPALAVQAGKSDRKPPPRQRGGRAALRSRWSWFFRGDYDAFRPSESANVIDFEGRTDTCAPRPRRACRSCRWWRAPSKRPGNPVVPGPGRQVPARRLDCTEIRFGHSRLTFGLPFGLTTVLPANIPLPSKYRDARAGPPGSMRPSTPGRRPRYRRGG